MGLIALHSETQPYDWGSSTAIAGLLGRAPSGGPEAELWLGAHPRSPSRLVMGRPSAHDLHELLGVRPELLGPTVSELPFLFKVLAADKPLSLQAHPSQEQARAGFARENALGIALEAPHRNYRDDNHKPELIHALTPFRALCGFSSNEEIARRLQHYDVLIDGGPLASVGGDYCRVPRDVTLRRLFRAIFALNAKQLSAATSRLLDRGRADIASSDASLVPEVKRLSVVLLALHALHGDDPGVLAAMLLNVVDLEPGQSLYLPAGVLHAYLDGLGLEIMASSDNVLRGGLTRKHVDVGELAATLLFESREPRPIAPTRVETEGGASLSRFVTPAPEFELSFVDVAPGQRFLATGPEILLVVEGKVTLTSQGETLTLTRGQEAFCSGDKTYKLKGQGRVARASINPEGLHA